MLDQKVPLDPTPNRAGLLAFCPSQTAIGDRVEVIGFNQIDPRPRYRDPHLHCSEWSKESIRRANRGRG